MSNGLLSQLDTYYSWIDEAQNPIHPDEVAALIDRRVREVTVQVPAKPRRGWPVTVAAAAAVFVIIGVAGYLSRTRAQEATFPSEAAVSIEPTRDAAVPEDLGVFEPIRGWIVYPTWDELQAVDPDDPANHRTLDLPPAAAGAQPAGWSADGSLLALSDEDADAWWVIDRTGEVATKLRDPGGCCVPMTSPWLSPNGRYAAMGLRIVDLRDAQAVEETFLWDDPSFIGADHPLERTAESLGDFEVSGTIAWSPDGAELALVADRDGALTVQIVDLETGASREVVGPGFGAIWHLAWSPTGSQLLLTASDQTVSEMFPNYDPNRNPLMVERWPANVYVVDLDEGSVREIATGGYRATTWSPDGTRVAAINHTASGKRIEVMNAHGTERRVLPEVATTGPFTGIAWHPEP